MVKIIELFTNLKTHVFFLIIYRIIKKDWSFLCFFFSFFGWADGAILFVFSIRLKGFWVFADGFFPILYWWLMISVRDLEHVASDEEDVDEEEKRSRRKSKKSGKVVAREHKDQLQRLKEKVRYALLSKDDMFC